MNEWDHRKQCQSVTVSVGAVLTAFVSLVTFGVTSFPSKIIPLVVLEESSVKILRKGTKSG